MTPMLVLALRSGCSTTHANVSYYSYYVQLLRIPPGSKDVVVFSPGGDKGATAALAGLP